ncbi:stress protein [Phocaeicola sartorii]|uniref:stress protein n=1 Tax=Phocaeicola sartorii TaxID=671267 RepID=UPI00263BA469|nr:stress protein [Phocaeicola sartorii]
MAIILEKSGDKHRIDLTKVGRTIIGEIKINLDWSKGGLLKQMFGKPIDLDLGCFYELRDGKKMLLDGLQFSHGRGGNRDQQTRQGCYTKTPFIWHKGDDRGGSSESGETILVNPIGIPNIKRIIVYTFIFEGVAKWADTNAIVKVSVPGCEDVVVQMGKQSSMKRFCAIASIEVNTDNSIEVQKLVTFHDSHSDCDKQYGWGFNYSPGSK